MAQQYVNNKEIPEKLYRYGYFDDTIIPFYNSEDGMTKEQEKWKYALFDGLVVPSNPIYFNDPYDCELCMSDSFLNIKENKKGVIKAIKNHCKPKSYDIARLEMSNNLLEDAKIVLSHYGLTVKDGYDKAMKNIIEEKAVKYRNAFRVSCFSEEYDSILMWSHYAKNHCGFCIEYDFRNDDTIKNYIKPVNYSVDRIVDNNYENNNWIEQSVLLKASIWSYEKEWRFFIPDITKLYQNNNEYYIDLKNDITAIYLGAKIDSIYQKTVTKFYKDKGIPIYKMDMKKDRFELYYKRLDV